MNYYTLGVLGHVDHGKTSLVKALTGVDTDRLKEEKERGISIALGYAYLDLPAGRVGIVDVPGHEKFIRTMVAGATGIRTVLFVLDVNEGVKPQTIEHLRIAELLGIQHGVVAITKCDTVSDPDMLLLAEEDLRELLEGTFLENAPFVQTSAENGSGLDELKNVLDRLLSEIGPVPDEGLPCLPVDRVFTIAGFGTVVTGTLQRGSLHVGDEVAVYPSGQRAQVRELQAHNEFVETVAPGHRTAVNLRGVEKNTIQRGDVVSAPDSLRSGKFLTVHIKMLADSGGPLNHRQIVRVLFGTLETYGRMHFLDRDALNPGDAAFAQIQLDEPAPMLFGDKVILRSYSPMTTIGGGTLLEVSEKRYKRNDESSLKWLETLNSGDVVKILEAAVHRDSTVNLPAFGNNFRCSMETLEKLVGEHGWPVLDGKCLASPDGVAATKSGVLSEVKKQHERLPGERGLSRDGITKALSTSGGSLIDFALTKLLEEFELALTEGYYHLPDFTPEGAMSETDRVVAEEIEAAFRDGGLQPPGMVDVLHDDKNRMRLYRMLVDSGELLPTYVANKPRTPSNTIIFHRESLAHARDMLRESFSNETGFTPAEARDVLHTTRKYLIPLLECLDRKGLTLRSGDKRVVR